MNQKERIETATFMARYKFTKEENLTVNNAIDLSLSRKRDAGDGNLEKMCRKTRKVKNEMCG